MAKAEIKIYVDGCFDLGHFGHPNLFRQAKALGGEGCQLIVGLHSDDEIKKHKRAPIFSQQEREQMIRGTKWVDDVSLNAPYIIDSPTWIRDEGYDFVVHGSDITTSSDGKVNFSSTF